MALSVKKVNPSMLNNGIRHLLQKSCSKSKPWPRWCNYRHSSRSFESMSTIDSDNVVRSKDPSGLIVDQTLPEFLWSNLHKWSDAPAFECAASGRKYTHEQIYKLSRNFAAALMQHGLGPSEVIALILPNIPEYPIAILGTWEANLIVTTVNPAYTPHEIAKQMKDSGAKAIVTLSDYVPLTRQVQSLCPTLKSVIAIGDATEGCHSFTEMLKVNSTGVEFAKGSKVDTQNQMACLPYSSGTTGPPKGVMLTHSNICSNIFQLTRPGYVNSKSFEGGNEQERFLGILPFFHIFGFTVTMAKTLYQGGFTMTLPKFEPGLFVKALRNHRPTFVHLVPPLISFMANSPEVTKKDFDSIHSIMGGAAPIGETLIKRVLEKAGKELLFQEGYGMTELSPVSHILPPSSNNQKMGSMGVVLPGTESKVVDVGSGRNVGVGERGELCVRGPQVMLGYFKNEKATKETIDEEGWLHTGDVAVFDEDHCFSIVDRMKELIKVKGLQVAPSELEDLLRTHGDIADVAVIGIPDERAGELPRAYIVKKQGGGGGGSKLTEDDVKKFVAEKVSKHKHLEGGVEFLEVIPKAASGKILRRELKATYLEKK